jgi:hypothetical protein
MPDSLKKCTTWIGLPILSFYLKKIKIGVCVAYTDLNRARKKRTYWLAQNQSGCGLHIQLQPSKFS